MDAALIFKICSTLILPQWLLMIIAPKWKWTLKLVNSKIIPLLLAAVYAFYVFQTFPSEEGGFGSLSEVMKLFSSETAVLVGWIHYLAFDLLIGSWVLKTAQKNYIHHGLVIPCLLGCFLLGPVGFLAFWIINRIKK